MGYQHADLGDAIEVETAFVVFEHFDDAHQRNDEQHQQNQIVVGIDLAEDVETFAYGLGEILAHGRKGLHHFLKLSTVKYFGHSWGGEIHDEGTQDVPAGVDERQHEEDGYSRGAFFGLNLGCVVHFRRGGPVCPPFICRFLFQGGHMGPPLHIIHFSKHQNLMGNSSRNQPIWRFRCTSPCRCVQIPLACGIRRRTSR